MKIPYLNNNLKIQQKQLKDGIDQKQKINGQKTDLKANTDSSEISGSFDDNRLSVAKSAILFDVSVKESDRISEIKAAVQNGTYHVPSDILAEELLK